MKKIKALALIACLAALAACTAPDRATRVLQDAGYTNITITGYDFFGCSEDDTYSTGFEATSVAGRQVEGVVCSGFFKGNTIRTY